MVASPNGYRGAKVFVTGHTGFKGTWLMKWLELLGAQVTGYSLAPESTPSHFDLLKFNGSSVVADIRDLDSLMKSMKEHCPEIIFHLAAQSLVRKSYVSPVETYDVNVMGTLKVLEAARKSPSVRAVIIVTSDKCYENREWLWGYRENDPMGGFDPYSSSKGCAEILTSSYRRSFLSQSTYGRDHDILLASVRAGNVIGGGDWAEDRLLPDIVRSATGGSTLEVRNPGAVRPWQHVLEPLAGYLTLGLELLSGKAEFADGWNFGPREENCLTVAALLELVKRDWPDLKVKVTGENLHEAKFLRLDSTKAQSLLNWQPKLDINETIKFSTAWYKQFYSDKKITTNEQITYYSSLLNNSRLLVTAKN